MWSLRHQAPEKPLFAASPERSLRDYYIPYPIRPGLQGTGEVQDVHYTFIDQDEFRAMIADGDFIEWAEVHGNFYGTSRRRIEDIINGGNDVILDIDVQGARQIREHYPNSTLIFILPPSMPVLEKRLFDRMSDSPESH